MVKQDTVERARSLGALNAICEAKRMFTEEADRAIREMVERLRATHDATWHEIGDACGTSKQNAQSRFGLQKVTIGGVPNYLQPKIEPSQLARLWNGPEEPLASIRRSTGGPAGVAAIFVDSSCVGVAYAKGATEAHRTNSAQADGIRGRLLKLVQQPTSGIVEALQQAFPDLLAQQGEPTPQQQARAALRAAGTYRLVETPDGASAKILADKARAVLRQQASHEEAPIRDVDVAWMSTATGESGPFGVNLISEGEADQ